MDDIYYAIANHMSDTYDIYDASGLFLYESCDAENCTVITLEEYRDRFEIQS